MAKEELIGRQWIIIRKLRKGPATLKEIRETLSRESELQDRDYTVSRKTFQRDIADISQIHNIEIEYNVYEKKYAITFDQKAEMTERMFEAYDTFNALNITDRLSNHIYFESRRPQGTENLYGLLHAIKNKLQISFTYQKFVDEEKSIRKCEPYALKEFRCRWYVIARDMGDKKVKSFAMDRLSRLDITQKKFQLPNDFDVDEHYRYSFGIISPNGDKPQEVILSFRPLQGKYIKSLPLHASQVILIDDKKELRVKLRLFVTYDFVMELLSFGDNVKVIAPDGLVQDIKTAFKLGLKRYK